MVVVALKVFVVNLFLYSMLFSSLSFQKNDLMAVFA